MTRRAIIAVSRNNDREMRFVAIFFVLGMVATAFGIDKNPFDAIAQMPFLKGFRELKVQAHPWQTWTGDSRQILVVKDLRSNDYVIKIWAAKFPGDHDLLKARQERKLSRQAKEAIWQHSPLARDGFVVSSFSGWMLSSEFSVGRVMFTADFVYYPSRPRRNRFQKELPILYDLKKDNRAVGILRDLLIDARRRCILAQ